MIAWITKRTGSVNRLSMNLYYIYDQNKPSEILYTAFALDNDHAYTLAQVAGIDLTGLTIDFVRKDPKDASGNLYLPDIKKGRAA